MNPIRYVECISTYDRLGPVYMRHADVNGLSKNNHYIHMLILCNNSMDT